MLVEKSTTGSTNDDARALAVDGAPEGTAVLAERQTQGRGRAGRSWESPAGGLYLSVVLRPRAPPEEWGILPLALGAAAARTLRGMGFEAGVKWPNDLWLAEKKVGGILVESRLGEHPFVIAGLGLNLHEAPAEGATSLAAHGAAPPLEELAESLRVAFVETARRLDRGESRALRDDVVGLCVSLGRRVEWEEGSGVAIAVDDDGALVVDDGGRRRRIVAGDVRLRWSAKA